MNPWPRPIERVTIRPVRGVPRGTCGRENVLDGFVALLGMAPGPLSFREGCRRTRPQARESSLSDHTRVTGLPSPFSETRPVTQELRVFGHLARRRLTRAAAPLPTSNS